MGAAPVPRAGTRAARCVGRGGSPRSVSSPRRERFGLGGDARDRGVGEGGDEAGIARDGAGRRPSRARGTRRRGRSAGRRARASRSACAAGSRLSSRTRPSTAGRRTAMRNAAPTTASTRASGSSGAARTAASMTTPSSLAVAARTASTSSSLLENQYRTVCLRTPTVAAISSRETPSTPRRPKRSSAAARIRSRVGPAVMCVVYHLVERRGRHASRDRRGPGRHSHRHHRVDRLRRDRARGAAAALGAGLRAGAARP